GVDGLSEVAQGAGAVVVVDVLRFTSAVSVAIGRGAVALPYGWARGAGGALVRAPGGAPGRAAAAYAARHDAELAGRREDGHWSLSPSDLARIPAGTRPVLPPPNGSAPPLGAHEQV